MSWLIVLCLEEWKKKDCHVRCKYSSYPCLWHSFVFVYYSPLFALIIRYYIPSLLVLFPVWISLSLGQAFLCCCIIIDPPFQCLPMLCFQCSMFRVSLLIFSRLNWVFIWFNFISFVFSPHRQRPIKRNLNRSPTPGKSKTRKSSCSSVECEE